MTFDIQAAKKTIQQRALERRRHLNSLAELAMSDAERITAMLIERFNPLRIYQWGSLLTPSCFREWSDIDFAVEGLEDPLAGLRAADEASRMTDFSVDLVEMERIHLRNAESIRKQGKLIYERK
jgi:predicted nucleotidyltransferase